MTMIDRDGYRPNVGIVLCNCKNEVFWGKRVRERWLRREWRGNYRGQKQIWFLLRLTGRDCDVCLRASEKPEFDAWRWHDYWAPTQDVVEFKRAVYEQALNELSRYLARRPDQQKRQQAPLAGV